MAVNSEISGDVRELIDYFDIEVERRLDFDGKYDDTMLKDHLDNLIKNENGWDKIAAACRRMIICDRELDLEKGTELMKDTRDVFNELKYEDQPYEAIRYANTCGLISFRCGDYSSALECFERAKKMAENATSMSHFVPDLTSNIIRTRFEFFSHTLPSKGIEIGDVDYYVRRFKENFIEKFKDALEESSQYYTDDGKLNLIYGHGMASLYHNLGDCYHILFKNLKTSDESKANDALNKSERCHRQSLKCGEKVDDEYRKLQSKRYLAILDTVDATERKHYDEDVLKGKWVRGRQMVYQYKIRESTNIEEINDMVKELKLDKNEKDKILLLYNYGAVKTAIRKNPAKSILDKNGKELTSLDVAKAKIDVAERMRNEFYLLYRRQAINLVRDDIFEIIEDCWKKGNYKEVINWSEKYSCRDLIELSQISLDKLLELTDEQREKIDESKKPIFKEDIRELNKHSIAVASSVFSTIGNVSELNKHPKNNFNIPLSLTLGTKNYDIFLDLILAYESVLEQPSKNFQPRERDVYKELIDLLIKIPTEENTAVLKFLISEQGGQENKMGHAILIKKKENEKVMEFDLDFVKDAKDLINGIEQCLEMYEYFEYMRYKGELHPDLRGRESELDKNVLYKLSKIFYDKSLKHITEKRSDKMIKLSNIMVDLFTKLELKKELDNVKNLFIIPDGELFQLPLHLMFKEIQDLNIYYSPTLAHLLTLPDYVTINNNNEANYLWVQCPAIANLCIGNTPALKHPECNNIKTLQCDAATLESFYESYEPNKYTHIGFSTHGFFHDHSKNAYVSQILFNDSFLTPYDILFQLDFGGVQTIFLGCCEIGSSKYTDENEAIGLVTAFLAKKAVSVIASLWKIDAVIHNNFIRAVDESGIADHSEAWSLADILCKFEDSDETIPFVQYASIAIVVRRLPKEAKQEILSYLQDDPLTYN